MCLPGLWYASLLHFLPTCIGNIGLGALPHLVGPATGLQSNRATEPNGYINVVTVVLVAMNNGEVPLSSLMYLNLCTMEP